MSSDVNFYLYARNIETNKYENIGWKDSDNNILPMFSGGNSYVSMVKDDFNHIDANKLENFIDLIKHGNECLMKNLRDIRYSKPVRKIMYIHYSCMDLVENDEMSDSMLDTIYRYEIDEEYKLPLVIDPRMYGQLIKTEKQKYIPFILKETEDRNDVLAMDVKKICKHWISEFMWSSHNYKKYDFEDVVLVANIYW